jgi:hypothetical protein
MAEKMIAVRECFLYNKRFKVGEAFPDNWIREGYLPNEHFAQESKAEELIAEISANRPVLCAGDDVRSNIELKKALKKYLKDFPEKWSRKQIWMELQKFEHGEKR